MRTALLLTAIVILAGCSPTPKPETKPEESATSTVLNGITGKTAVDAGKRARNQIEAISAKHDAELNEVMGE